ncbi:NAD(P)/FAD-dependent oxidoreductase [Natrialba asiatica]|uniref:FAD-dependent pyridine nucleotide-disulfide oxidoreductase n=1 Tax=Natrialba asiatica (strain ATCC 700177 / DSM 12278 / JCM 9576 / FERM P-10747 / NBRC 102637 / 172P1) TaxID=29540 RepID=M0ATJ1_NATA1|nr:NAD(P)/FAD-dependent oxidoreductase [Natrialba asiatica]ELZ01870.1 FAD-dependent pyridine nucleotide-disulfide oxidoreductase [Natrialba asiatica DSM 12278]
MERVEVAVVGGGPAGATAAERAAAHGAETVLFEQGVPREDREGLGPDSTDAAGMLDYWIDIMDFDYAEIPDDVVLQELEGTEFVGPNSAVELTTTGMDASYPKFGYTFHRARMDDWLYERATDAGADLRVGTGVSDLETDLRSSSPKGPTHTLTLSNGDQIEAQYVILADGPQRRITLEALDQFTPPGRSIADALSPPTANHIAYQEYREFPEELFDPDWLKFWWGYMPGETAYPWVFPNDGTVARVGLTMPIGMELDDVDNPASYALLDSSDERLPSGSEYITRLLEHEFGDEYDIESDMPIVEDRGKSTGTETYPISSTRPIDSPVGANIAVAGGAMGTTSAFHEGGYHVAVRTGKIAGRLAATDSLEHYNDLWKRAIGDEILRNVAFADIVADYEPGDWDRAFDIVTDMQGGSGENVLLNRTYGAGIAASKLLVSYKKRKFTYRNGTYVQFDAGDYHY